jgi:hypothetical protein
MTRPPCDWPKGHCQNWAENEVKPDPWGRVWMHCESGLSMSNSSLAKFLSFCLKNNVKIGSVGAFDPKYARSMVMAAIRLQPSQFAAFEQETGGKLREPPKVSLNCSATKDDW